MSFSLAMPKAWFVLAKWLEYFAYRIQIHWLVFLLTTLIVLLLVVLTMGIHSMKAALSNPVKSLRTE